MSSDRTSPPHRSSPGGGAAFLGAAEWPEEEVALGRAAAGLLEGEALPLAPAPARLREALRMAGDLGLFVAHVPGAEGGPDHGVGASLLATEASAKHPAWASLFDLVMGRGVDPLLLAGEGHGEPDGEGSGERAGPRRALLRAIGLCQKIALGPPPARSSFGSVHASLRDDGVVSVAGSLDLPFEHLEVADLFVVPATLDTGGRVLCFVETRAEGVSAVEEAPAVEGSPAAAGAPAPTGVKGVSRSERAPEAEGPGSSAGSFGRVALREVRVPPSRLIEVSGADLETFSDMRRLRGAFSLAGAGASLQERAEALISSADRSAGRLTGGTRARLAASGARAELARMLAHEAGKQVSGRSRGLEGPAALGGIREGLTRSRSLIALSHLTGWLALSSLRALVRDLCAGGGGLEGEPAALASAYGSIESRHAEEAAECAEMLFARGAPGPTPSRLVESPLSAAAYETAVLALGARSGAGEEARARSAEDAWALAMNACGLDVEAARASGADPQEPTGAGGESTAGEGDDARDPVSTNLEPAPSIFQTMVESSGRALRAREAGRRTLEACLPAASLENASRSLETLWRLGPFRRPLVGELAASMVQVDLARLFPHPTTPVARGGNLESSPATHEERGQEARKERGDDLDSSPATHVGHSQEAQKERGGELGSLPATHEGRTQEEQESEQRRRPSFGSFDVQRLRGAFEILSAAQRLSTDLEASEAPSSSSPRHPADSHTAGSLLALRSRLVVADRLLHVASHGLETPLAGGDPCSPEADALLADKMLQIVLAKLSSWYALCHALGAAEPHDRLRRLPSAKEAREVKRRHETDAALMVALPPEDLSEELWPRGGPAPASPSTELIETEEAARAHIAAALVFSSLSRAPERERHQRPSQELSLLAATGPLLDLAASRPVAAAAASGREGEACRAAERAKLAAETVLARSLGRDEGGGPLQVIQELYSLGSSHPKVVAKANASLASVEPP